MWPFGKTKTLREIEIERFPELVRSISQKWPEYIGQLEAHGLGKPPLEVQLATFGVRAAAVLRETHFAVRRSPDTYFMLAIAVGIIHSKVYERWEVEEAAGFRVPLSALLLELKGTEY